jgi:hypothetical protein
MSKIEETKELMHILVPLLLNQAPTYHYKLTGNETECLSHLMELDEAGMHHLLHKCGLFDGIYDPILRILVNTEDS